MTPVFEPPSPPPSPPPPPPEVSTAAEELYEAILPLVGEDEDHDWTGLRLCMAITSGNIEFLHEILIDTDVSAGWEILFDPQRCPLIALPYLAQFAGAVLTADMSEASKRSAIGDPEAYRTGRIEQIRAVAERRLSGEKIVNITERYTGSAWRLKISTNASETPEEAATIADIKREAKPIGIVLFFNAAAAWTWGEIAVESATYPTWKKIEESFKTWGEEISHVP